MSTQQISARAVDGRWWTDEYKDDRHLKILNIIRLIRRRQVHWHRRDLLHAWLYGNLPILGFGPASYARINPAEDTLRLNMIKPLVDTWVSMIGRSRPEPKFLPIGAEPGEAWTLRKRCKGLERWSKGLQKTSKFHDEIAPRALLDVGVFDYGLAKVVIEGVDESKSDEKEAWKDAEVCIEHVHAFEMTVDDLEALTGNPRSLYQRRWVDRSVLIAKFPKSTDELLDTPQRIAEEDDWAEWGYNDSCDQILVTESWHLPSGKGATDGRHCIIVNNATLLDEQYDDDRFPFAFLRQTPVPWGVRGIPITAQLRPLQLFLNQGMEDFQDSMALYARPKWLSPRQGNIEKGHLDDDIGTIIEYDHPFAPQPLVPGSLPPDAINFVWQVWDKGSEIVGISQYKTAGLVPQNVKSGRAAEVLNDTQDGRFLISSKLFEAWCMEIVDLAICKAREIAKHRPDYAMRYSHRKYVQLIKFSEVDMDRDKYSLECYPASSFANTPSARYDQLSDAFDRGLIDMPTFRRQLGFPDLDGEFARLNAPYELADWLIERYLDADEPDAPGTYIAPEPSWPLQVLYERFLYAETGEVSEGAPDANMDLLRRFRSQLEDTAKKVGIQLPGMPAPGQAPMANMPAPTAGGGPAPAPMGGPPLGPPPPGPGLPQAA